MIEISKLKKGDVVYYFNETLQQLEEYTYTGRRNLFTSGKQLKNIKPVLLKYFFENKDELLIMLYREQLEDQYEKLKSYQKLINNVKKRIDQIEVDAKDLKEKYPEEFI